MERRMTAQRRQEHLFVASERRAGPYDRRNAGTRFQEREAERAKIERIRAFKQKDQTVSHDNPVFTKQRLVFLGVALLILALALFLI